MFIVSRMSTLTITVLDHHQGGGPSSRRFVTSPVRIGRDPSNDLHLPHAFVSRWHAVVRYDRGVASLLVLTEGNGVVVAGQRHLAGAALPIAPRLIATIGAIELHLEHNPGCVDAIDGALPADDDHPAARAHAAIDRLQSARSAWQQALDRERLALRADPEAADLFERQLIPLSAQGLHARGPHTSGPDAAAELAAHLLPDRPLPATHEQGLRLARAAGQLLRHFAEQLLRLHAATAADRHALGLPAPVLPVQLPADAERLLESMLAPNGLTDLTPAAIDAVITEATDHAQSLATSALRVGEELARRLDPAAPGAPTHTAPRWSSSRRRLAALGQRYDQLLGPDRRRTRATLLTLLVDAYTAARRDPT